MKTSSLWTVMLMTIATAAVLPARTAGAQVAPQRVVEFWEDASDPASDDNDAQNQTQPAGADGVVDTRRAGETITRGLSGMAWGAYTGSSRGTDHAIDIFNLEGGLGTGTLANSHMRFRRHSQASAGDFPAGYSDPLGGGGMGAELGSYIYTLFSSNTSVPQSIDARQGLFKIGLSHDQGVDQTGTIVFRFLIQTDGLEWYRSSPVETGNVRLLENPFGGNASNDLTAAGREDLLSTHDFATVTWEQVGGAAETNMNALNDGGEVALGSGAGTSPNLANVTGMGVLISNLAEGRNLSGQPNDVDVIGILIEGAEPVPGIQIVQLAQTVAEGAGSASFDVALDFAIGTPVTLNFASANGSAVAGEDYTASSGSLTFSPGETSKTITVPILDDGTDEIPIETFFVQLTNIVGATLAGSDTHAVSIQDNDPAPVASLTLDSASPSENGGVVTGTITLATPSSAPVNVGFQTLAVVGGPDEPATPRVDYVAASGTVQFAPGETVGTFMVAIIDDQIDEPSEVFDVTIGPAAYGPFASLELDPVTIDAMAQSIRVTIQDDDTDVQTTIAMETWESVSELILSPAGGTIPGSDMIFFALDGGSAPLDRLRVAAVDTAAGSSVALQRFEFATESAGFGMASDLFIGVGNGFEAMLPAPIDDDTVLVVGLQARVFIGPLTPTGRPNFPASGDEVFAPTSHFIFAVGSGDVGSLPPGLPAPIGGPFSLAFRLNNYAENGGASNPRLEFAVNQGTFGMLDGLFPLHQQVNKGMASAPEGVGLPMQGTIDTGMSPPATGGEYLIDVQFRKMSFTETEVTYTVTDLTGTGFETSSPQTVTIPAAFPFHKMIDYAGISLGSGFGFGDGVGDNANSGGAGEVIPDSADQGAQGSWVDDLQVYTFGVRAAAPLAARAWTIYKK